jgi:hypothetical protein
MTEVLKKRGRRKRPTFYGGGFPESDNVAYLLSVGDYVLAGIGGAEPMESPQLGAPKERGLQAHVARSYFPTEVLPEAQSYVLSRGSWPTYGDMYEYSLSCNTIMRDANWGALYWLARWADRIGPNETPEHFELSPLSERRATGKVRKYYEPADFLFVEDDEVSIEDTEY